MKRLRLKRCWCFVLGVVVTLFSMLTITVAIDYVKEELHKCDRVMNKTCSIYDLKNYRNN